MAHDTRNGDNTSDDSAISRRVDSGRPRARGGGVMALIERVAAKVGGRSEGEGEGQREVLARAREEARRELGSSADISLGDWEENTAVCEQKSLANSAELDRLLQQYVDSQRPPVEPKP